MNLVLKSLFSFCRFTFLMFKLFVLNSSHFFVVGSTLGNNYCVIMVKLWRDYFPINTCILLFMFFVCFICPWWSHGVVDLRFLVVNNVNEWHCDSWKESWTQSNEIRRFPCVRIMTEWVLLFDAEVHTAAQWGWAFCIGNGYFFLSILYIFPWFVVLDYVYVSPLKW